MTDKNYVWDRFIRIFHWSLVLAFVTSYLTGDENETIHVYSGYFILALITARIIWGFVGPQHARFSDFVKPPSEAFSYVKGFFCGNSQRYEGHNPAGGWMTILLLLALSLTGVSGLKLYGVEGHGPLAITNNKSIASLDREINNSNLKEYRRESSEYSEYEYKDEDEYEYENEWDDDIYEHEEHEDEEREEFWEDIHEFFVNFTLLLIFLHVSGVLLSSFSHRENLIAAMFTGYKKS